MVTTWTNLKDPAKLRKPDTGQTLRDLTYAMPAAGLFVGRGKRTLLARS